MPQTIQYVPADRPRGGVTRRIIFVSALLCALCVVLAYALPQRPYPPPNLIWLLFAFWPGLIAVLTALGRWVATGRL